MTLDTTSPSPDDEDVVNQRGPASESTSLVATEDRVYYPGDEGSTVLVRQGDEVPRALRGSHYDTAGIRDGVYVAMVSVPSKRGG